MNMKRSQSLAILYPQCVCRFDIEFEMAFFLVNHHAVISSRGFERDVSGPHIGENTLRIALQGIPKSAATADFD